MTEETAEFEYDLGERSVAFVLDETLYARDSIYGAAYLFVDRAWIHLTRPADQRVGVQLKSKEPATPQVLEALAGEFANELLNQEVRRQVGEATAEVRQYYMARAFFSDDRRAHIDSLLAELDAEELDEDPLEIQVPWAEEPAGS